MMTMFYFWCFSAAVSTLMALHLTNKDSVANEPARLVQDLASELDYPVYVNARDVRRLNEDATGTIDEPQAEDDGGTSGSIVAVPELISSYFRNGGSRSQDDSLEDESESVDMGSGEEDAFEGEEESDNEEKEEDAADAYSWSYLRKRNGAMMRVLSTKEEYDTSDEDDEDTEEGSSTEDETTLMESRNGIFLLKSVGDKPVNTDNSMEEDDDNTDEASMEDEAEAEYEENEESNEEDEGGYEYSFDVSQLINK